MPIEISHTLCICTRHRPDDLQRALLSIANSTCLPNQVVVSDDGEDGRTVEGIVKNFPFAEYQRGPRIGLGANRNACLKVVRSSFVSFIDDDVTLPPEFISLVYEISALNITKTPPPLVSGVEMKHLPDGQVIRIEPANADFWGFQRLKPKGDLKAMVINAGVFPMELFRKAQFDPKLRYGSEEIDMIRHATSLGYRVEFNPLLWVNHFPSEIGRSEYKSVVDASRMYATAKDYWTYQGDVTRALFFLVLAPIKLGIGLGRRSGLRGVLDALKATRLALSYGLRGDTTGHS